MKAGIVGFLIGVLFGVFVLHGSILGLLILIALLAGVYAIFFHNREGV